MTTLEYVRRIIINFENMLNILVSIYVVYQAKVVSDSDMWVYIYLFNFHID
jgi:hypothetical protein